jgi:F-type H+-transporting ATPase subunit delta
MTSTQRVRRLSRDLYRLCLVNGVPEAGRVRGLARRVLASGTRDRFQVLTRFLRLVRLDEIRHTATVQSAEPLAPPMRASLEAGLARFYGPGLTVAFTERPDLIGGMRIRVGSDLYDGSVRGRLAALAARF